MSQATGQFPPHDIASQVATRRARHPSGPRLPGTFLHWWSAGVFLLFAGVLLGWYVTVRGPVGTGEMAVDQWLHDHQRPWLDGLSVVVALGLGPIAAPITILLMGAVVWRRHRWAATVAVVTTMIGWLSVGFGKLFFHRARPPFASADTLSFEGQHDSFPSGHVAFAVALTLALVLAARAMKRSTLLIWIVGIMVTAVVAVARMYAGAHFWGDVAAAPLFAGGGVCCLIACWSTLPVIWQDGIYESLTHIRRHQRRH
ncbi:hypothetical protein KEM60_03123 [Austwickia sp. TVS 96-490-7B]|uniref:phosphatase PAP2 family protein n=1 Tax=Austwickia sp. TVS 96-490-7B TaxID=2830843 RepID=UPI001C56C1EB|nr:phosphatase PAP2 family protein [Austwickia sp. TVS 96-490-7B]MBW3086894.1 hypothetical protein [Austwickia sp. TVS 96-490-7B]